MSRFSLFSAFILSFQHFHHSNKISRNSKALKMWWKSWRTPPPPPPWIQGKDILLVTPSNVAYSCVVIIWAMLVIKSYACVRQITLNYIVQRRIPPELHERMNPSTFLKAKEYEKTKIILQIFKPFYYVLIRSILLYIELPWTLILKSRSFVEYLILLNIWPSHLYTEVGVFLFTLILNVFCLQYINLPVECFSVFLVDEMHGRSKQSIPYFISQRLKEMAPIAELFLAIIGYALIIKEVNKSDTLKWIFFGIMGFIFSHVNYLMNNKFTSLKEGQLLIRLQVLVKYCGFKLRDVKVLKVSPRTTRICQNEVYFEGYGTSKNLILPERLLMKCDGVSQLEYHEEGQEMQPAAEESKDFTLDEVEALVAQELGQWKRYNVWWKLMVKAASGVLSMAVISYYIFKKETIEHFAEIVSRVEKDEDLLMKHFILTMYLFSLEIYGVYYLVTDCLRTNTHRTFEYSADNYAVQLGYGKALREAIIKISCDNLEYPYCDSLFSFFFNRNPPTLKRIKATDEAMRKNQ